ncbi:hypothetical protein V6N12_007758 [Hibiscus sabdariffa]|uniref:Uncharacterized protein n=1 Tax=Hibiscus sabdariffa TaxID=183260 RepID=A0ABR2F2Q0_9ROSI
MSKSDETEEIQERTLKEITADLDTIVRRLYSVITRIDQNENAVENLTQTVAKLNAQYADNDTSGDAIRCPNLFPIENRRQHHQPRRDTHFNDQRQVVRE